MKSVNANPFDKSIIKKKYLPVCACMYMNICHNFSLYKDVLA